MRRKYCVAIYIGDFTAGPPLRSDLIAIYNTHFNPDLWSVQPRDTIDAITHIARIVTGVDPESGLLLYVNSDNELFKFLADRILKKGRQSVLVTYYPTGIYTYRVLGPKYPSLDK